MCFFCSKSIDISVDHQASTFSFDTNVRIVTTALQRRDLIVKLSQGDTTAIDAVYHKKCYTDIYIEYRSFEREQKSSSDIQAINEESIALAELISFMENFNDGSNKSFKLSELVEMYSNHLVEVGGSKTKGK